MNFYATQTKTTCKKNKILWWEKREGLVGKKVYNPNYYASFEPLCIEYHHLLHSNNLFRLIVS